jgi:peptidoglycan L-alanyl-D-glutamate endopeptidase CwlK
MKQMFKLSRRSLDRLEGVDWRLQAVAKQAITLTKTDFGVIQGIRTLEQQKELVAKGASQTMKSSFRYHGVCKWSSVLGIEFV